MQALIEMSLWLEIRIPLIRQIHLTQILEDQLTVLLAELSMFREARNQIKLRRNFVDSPLLYVPACTIALPARIYWLWSVSTPRP